MKKVELSLFRCAYYAYLHTQYSSPDPSTRFTATKINMCPQAKKEGAICCEENLDCVYESPTMSRCVRIPELSEEDNPFGDVGRPRATPKGEKCGGSPEGAALTSQCAEGRTSIRRSPSIVCAERASFWFLPLLV